MLASGEDKIAQTNLNAAAITWPNLSGPAFAAYEAAVVRSLGFQKANKRLEKSLDEKISRYTDKLMIKYAAEQGIYIYKPKDISHNYIAGRFKAGVKSTTPLALPINKLPDQLNPLFARGLEEVRVLSILFHTLMELDPVTKTVEPKLAESLEQLEDPRKYKLTLKPNVKWSDEQNSQLTILPSPLKS